MFSIVFVLVFRPDRQVPQVVLDAIMSTVESITPIPDDNDRVIGLVDNVDFDIKFRLEFCYCC